MYIFVTGFEFKLREVSRRVIMGLVVDHELDFTEIRVRQLASVVDLFVILESNITTGKTEPCWWTQVRVQVLNNWLYNFVLSLIFCWILFMLWELLLPRLCFHGHVLPMFRTRRVTIFIEAPLILRFLRIKVIYPSAQEAWWLQGLKARSHWLI